MISSEQQNLFKIVKTQLGAPIRPVQLTDDMLCNLLQAAIGDYSKQVQNFITQSNWMSIYGKNSAMTPLDLAYAISLREMNLTQQISYYFSKEVGLQQRGNFELKKDFFTIEKGKQVYIVEDGREINDVMWCTPSTTKAALYGANYGGFDNGMFGGTAQFGNMASGFGLGSFFFGSMYDTALTAATLKYANSMMRSDLCYKVTAGPDGTHLIHLLSTPGSKNSMGVVLDDASMNSFGWSNYIGCYVWYTYYDISGATDEEVDECRKSNKSVLLSPETVPFDKMEYEYLNDPAQQTVRQLLTSEAMRTLSFVRGYASGKISIPDAELQLDYSMFRDEATNLKNKAIEDLDKFLESLLPWNVMKNQADMMDSAKKILDQTPLGLYAI